jgi:hypothetical protein
MYALLEDGQVRPGQYVVETALGFTGLLLADFPHLSQPFESFFVWAWGSCTISS